MIFQKRCVKRIYPYCIGEKCPHFKRCYLRKLILMAFTLKD